MARIDSIPRKAVAVVGVTADVVVRIDVGIRFRAEAEEPGSDLADDQRAAEDGADEEDCFHGTSGELGGPTGSLPGLSPGCTDDLARSAECQRFPRICHDRETLSRPARTVRTGLMDGTSHFGNLDVVERIAGGCSAGSRRAH